MSALKLPAKNTNTNTPSRGDNLQRLPESYVLGKIAASARITTQMDGHDSAHREGRSVCLRSSQSPRSYLCSTRSCPPPIKTHRIRPLPLPERSEKRWHHRLPSMSTAEVTEVPAVPAEPPAAEAPVEEVLPEPKPTEEKPVREKKPRAPKAPRENKPKAPKPSTPAHPPYFQMIKEAILALNEKTGSSSYAIAKHMEEKHKGVLPANYKKVLAIQLRNFTAKGKLVKVKASFKLSESGKEEEKKNKKKKTPAKKAASAPATRRASVAATKKSSKPSKAKKMAGVKKAKKATPAKPKQPKSIKSPAAKKAKKATA